MLCCLFIDFTWTAPMQSWLLYYTVLLLLSTRVHLTDSLTITSVTQSDGSAGALPAQISLPSGRSGYNLQAGDTVIIKCDDSITRPKILTPSHPLAQVCIHRFGTHRCLTFHSSYRDMQMHWVIQRSTILAWLHPLGLDLLHYYFLVI